VDFFLTRLVRVRCPLVRVALLVVDASQGVGSNRPLAKLLLNRTGIWRWEVVPVAENKIDLAVRQSGTNAIEEKSREVNRASARHDAVPLARPRPARVWQERAGKR